MFEWSDEHAMIRDAVRQFVETEIRPRRDELEFGDTPPYDVLRTMFRTFGLDALAREQFKKRIEDEERAPAAGSPAAASDDRE
ncbi:MAG: acyl-CoA dehydrogenase family protein, partial [Acidimicrobiia bacterium]